MFLLPPFPAGLRERTSPRLKLNVALGNIAGRPDGTYFWERAGIDTSELPDPTLRHTISSIQTTLEDFNLITSKKVSQHLAGKGNAVAIPLMNVTAFGDRVPPHENVRLSQAKVEDVLLAPLSWCPHPENMISMHVAGDSMHPVIPSGSVLFVDTAATDRDQVNGRLVVASHRDLGFKVARLQRLAGSDLLVSANPKYLPIDVSNATRWKIFGEVLWWVTKDVKQES
ncbi:S24 family peptidase [Telmatobacter sp. DSM 110680]|uniref:S24 family peptidase n=1 Tax=Telmatobacter sp. DSM 110680 TaxID=3036704 RepID=A0AAU7DEA1_9BACT